MVFFLAGCSLPSFNAGTKGIYKSTDGGQTFEPILKYVDEKKDLSGVNILTIEVDPVATNIVYLGTLASGVFKSTNGGEVWEQIATYNQVYGIEVDRRNHNVIYVSGMENNQSKVFKSTDQGATFKEIYAESAFGTIIADLEIDNFDPDILYLGSTSGILSKTSDAGKEWKRVAQFENIVADVVMDSNDTRVVYARVHEAGIYRVDFRNIEQSETEVYNLMEAAPPQLVFEETVFSLESDPKKGGFTYAGSNFGMIRTTDQGQTWGEVPTLNTKTEKPIRTIDIAQSSETMCYGHGGAFYLSHDHGKTWEVSGFETPFTIEALAIDPSDSNIIYLGVRQRED